ncbi:methyltransferase RsmF C-terminal domain-like protein [Ferruginibacter albus]|uniref:methyltransferase RsmF C-terminal domain-like protein n=1 Tax=Ferruginibacter albus TaxID=2875540 RepID=UPI001CC52064|nr:RsmB/NOP family class I SAM-dependent RNA methyltransferase [Ferruginibacter albus]UAY52439.1 RNA methyltransferase [Ferruginibacter albus]
MNDLPISLLNSLENLQGFNKEAFQSVHQSGEQVTSIRFNNTKIPNYKFQIADLETGIWDLEFSKIPWNSHGYYLSQRPSFTLDPLFHAGAYYVQEASSMFLEEVIKQTVDLSASIKVLDLCAAPGGKSTLIHSLISKDSLLVSNEVIKTRVNILSENMTKWGAANVIVTNNDPKDFQRLESFFDIIVVDAPCSGSGLFRKDNDAITEWSEENVNLCSQRQQRILADILPALKENGVLIYSTCSYSKAEDEDIANWLTKEQKLISCKLSINNEWGIVETQSAETNAYGYRFYPDKVKGEGFFIAAFKKQSTENHLRQIKNLKNQAKLSAKEIDTIKPYIQNVDDYIFIKQYEDILALPASLENDLGIIQSSLYIKKAGVKLGSIIRNELIPDHELAMSTLLNNDLPAIEVDKETALNYLRRSDIKPDVDHKGWLLISYQQIPLGWVKALPNRINNYYPKEWRILNK